jgi:hypothetical protein
MESFRGQSVGEMELILSTITKVLERQAPGHVTTLMQDTLSDIISLQFKKCSV